MVSRRSKYSGYEIDIDRLSGLLYSMKRTIQQAPFIGVLLHTFDVKIRDRSKLLNHCEHELPTCKPPRGIHIYGRIGRVFCVTWWGTTMILYVFRLFNDSLFLKR